MFFLKKGWTNLNSLAGQPQRATIMDFSFWSTVSKQQTFGDRKKGALAGYRLSFSPLEPQAFPRLHFRRGSTPAGPFSIFLRTWPMCSMVRAPALLLGLQVRSLTLVGAH